MIRAILPRRRGGESLIRYDDYRPFTGWHREMNDLIKSMFGELEFPYFENDMRPKFEVTETEKEVKVTAELPGVDQKELDISVENNILTIKGEKKEEKDEKDKETECHFSERSYGMFQRSFSLPENLDQKGIKAGYSDGVLTVTLPKTKTPKSARKKIEIKAA